MMLGSGSVESLARQRKAMDTKAPLTESLMLNTFKNFLVTMARTVESPMTRALDAIVSLDDPRTAALPGEVFLLEPRINEMEIVIDEQAIRLLRQGALPEEELRLIVAGLELNKDLERIGGLAANLAERGVSLREKIGRAQV